MEAPAARVDSGRARHALNPSTAKLDSQKRKQGEDHNRPIPPTLVGGGAVAALHLNGQHAGREWRQCSDHLAAVVSRQRHAIVGGSQ